LTGFLSELVPIDLDQDGDLDLVSPAGSSGLGVLSNDNGLFGLPQFITPVTAQINKTIPSDLDGDGDTDLAAISSTNILTLLNQVGSMSMGQSISIPEAAFTLLTADLTGDTIPEIITLEGAAQFNGDLDGVLRILNNDGQGIFTPGQSITVSAPPSLMGATDLDQDGAIDLVVVTFTVTDQIHGAGFAEVRAFLNEGGLSFTEQILFQTSVTPIALALADLTGDGAPEILLSEFFSNDTTPIFSEVLLARNQGNGTFAAPTQFSSASSFDFSSGLLVATGDMDGDGTTDVAVGDSTSGTTDLQCFLNVSGNGQTFTLLTLPLGPTFSLSMSDLNQDQVDEPISIGFQGFTYFISQP
jgi:large repetitive protein